MSSTIANGNYSSSRMERGALVEYADVDKPLTLNFEFNPTTISRTRDVTIRTGGAAGTQGGYDFADVSEVVRASQGVTVTAESFSVKILLDATDRLNAGDQTAQGYGVQPEIDILRSMVEPKTQTPDGARTLAALGEGDARAFSRQVYASVLLFHWGIQVLPVFLTQVQVDAKEYLPNLYPYRAEASIKLQVIESNNPFYQDEVKRQMQTAGMSEGSAQGFNS